MSSEAIWEVIETIKGEMECLDPECHKAKEHMKKALNEMEEAYYLIVKYED